MRRLRYKLLVVVAIFITCIAFKRKFSSLYFATAVTKTIKKDLSFDPVTEPVPPPQNHVDVPPQNHPDDATLKNSTLAEKASNINFAQKMYNTDLYGNHTADSVVLAVQVHDRAIYFQELLNSLQNAREISKATLVISMDKFSEKIDRLISTIQFCRYMVIFFPYSMQLYPNKFPGKDPNDCPRNIPKSEAIKRKCNNAEYPDRYGHYREVKYVQIKHHWMWKLHMLFTGIKTLSTFQGPVVLLEEDYYVLPDLIHCSKKALSLKNAKCGKCSLISLGNYNTRQDYSHNDEVEIEAWVSSKSNMGLVLSRASYDIISKASDVICEHDDYNWDWSLQYALQTNFPGSSFTIQFKATRLFHLGSCSGMHSEKSCDIQTELQNIKKKTNGLSLFPEKLHVALDNPAMPGSPPINGGWGDIRDHLLCKSYRTLYTKPK